MNRHMTLFSIVYNIIILRSKDHKMIMIHKAVQGVIKSL